MKLTLNPAWCRLVDTGHRPRNAGRLLACTLLLMQAALLFDWRWELPDPFALGVALAGFSLGLGLCGGIAFGVAGLLLNLIAFAGGKAPPDAASLLAVLAGFACIGAWLHERLIRNGRRPGPLRPSQSPQLLQSLWRTSPDCLALLDREGRLISVSDAGLTLMELASSAEALGRACVEFWPEASRAVVGQALAAALRGESARFQGFCPTVKGNARWWDVSLAPVRGSGGRTDYLLLIARDITSLKESERAVLSARDRLQNILVSIDEAFFSLGRDWRFVDANPAMERLVGRTQGELLGRNIWEEFPHAIGSIYYFEYLRVMETGEAATFDTYYPAADAWFEVRAFNNGDGLSVFLRDISERVSSQRSIERKRLRLLQAQQIAGLSFWETELSSGATVWSSELRALLGQAGTGEVHTGDLLRFIPEEEHDGVLDLWAAAVRRGKPVSLEHRLCLGARTVHVLQRCECLNDGKGRAARLVGTFLDITERTRDAEALRESERFTRAIIDALPQQLCVLDEHGVILAVNAAWRRHALDNAVDPASVAEGADYLSVCRRALGREDADGVAAAIGAVLAGSSGYESRDYSIALAGREEWYTVNITAFAGDGPRRVVISHERRTDYQQALRALRSSEERYELVSRGANDGLWDWNIAAGEAYVSERCWRLLGYSVSGERFAAAALLSAVHPAERPAVKARLASHFKRHGPFDVELRLRTQDGRFRWFRARGQAVWNDAGRAVRMAGSIVDITDLKNTLQALREREQLFSEFANHTPEAFWIYEVRLQALVYVNPAFARLWNKPAELLYADFGAWASCVHPADAALFARAAAEFPQRPRTLEYRILQPDGSVRWVHERGLPLSDEKGQVYRYLGVLRDVTEQRQAQDELSLRAHYDFLTGLPNRTAFLDRVQKACDLRQTGQEPAAIAFVDLDRFKRINDTLGHAVGDQLLIEVARCLHAAVGADALVGRLDGDEFGVFLPRIGSLAAVADRCRDWNKAFARPFLIKDYELFGSVSIGVSGIFEDMNDLTTVLRRADIALHEAKLLGGNTFQVYKAEFNDRHLHRLRLEGLLRQALERGEFELLYQPQACLERGGRVVGFEALLRWNSAELGQVTPDRFIPVLEETGDIVAVGKWVMREACRQAAAWRAAGRDVTVSVNVSARQFQDAGFVLAALQALEDVALPPDRLELEITETCLIVDPERARAVIRDLRAYGVKLALDDFGVGYSSLSHIKQFQPDTLKIDRSFVADLQPGTDSERLVAAVIGLASSLGITVVAEGVETPEQLAVLTAHGCGCIQGYLLSPPKPAAGLEHLPTLRYAPRGDA